MRLALILLAALLSPATAHGAAAAPGSSEDTALRAALERAHDLEGEARFAEITALLEPWADAADPDVDYTLAYARFNAEMNGRRVEDFADADLAESERLALRAAGNGHAGAMNLLYMIHGNGYGREADGLKAMAWLERAVEAGDVGAKVNLATMLYEGRPWLGRDRDRACRLFVDVGGNEGAGAFSLYYLGLATMRGECGLEEDDAKAASFIRRAAEGGITGAERDYGQLLEEGIGVERDIAEALRWYERAAEHGDGYALWRLGIAHVEGGPGRAVDPVRAVDYFRDAIEAGNGDALVSMAVMYASGSGVDQDLGQALAYYRRGADAGEAHAYRGLALMALRGEGMAPDPELARLHYEKAIELGNAEEPALRDAINEALGLPPAPKDAKRVSSDAEPGK